MHTLEPKQAQRELHILDVAAELIIHHGYDKTTMSDIAAAAGIGRGVLYLHFENKEKLFEALLLRETLAYSQNWLERLQADAEGSTVAAMYRNVLAAINSRPFMAAMMRRDRHVFGSYLRKPGNLFATLQAKSSWTETLRALQAAGTVRDDIDPAVLACILDMQTYGLVNLDQFRQPNEIPPFDQLMEGIALLMDQALTPDGGGDRAAGKAIIRDFAITALARFAQSQPGQSAEETIARVML